MARIHVHSFSVTVAIKHVLKAFSMPSGCILLHNCSTLIPEIGLEANHVRYTSAPTARVVIIAPPNL